MSKRIVLVGNTTWSMFNFRLPLFNLLRGRGYDVHIVAPPDVYSEKVQQAGFTFHPIKIDSKGSNPLRDIGTYRAFYQLYRKLRPDLAVHYTIKPNIYGTIAANRLSIPTIAITTGLGQIFDEQTPRSVVARKLYRFAFKMPVKVLFLNEDDRDTFLAEDIIINPARTQILNGEGVDTTQFARRETLPTRVRTFLLVGRLLWPKGVGEYAQAARQLREKYPTTKFNILGFLNPKDPTSLRLSDLQRWKREGITEYLGSTENVASYIEQSTCLVLPSYYREGVPRVLLEAASMSTPIITTDNVGCREVVADGENGYLVPVKDPDALAEAMEKILLAEPKDLYAMGAAGRRFVEEKFSTATVNHQLLKLFDTTIGR